MATSKKETSNNVISTSNNVIPNSATCNTSRSVTLYRYSPENIPHEILKNIFVGRDDLFERIFKELETAGKNKTPRFYLVVGSRGIGKSHFLILLYREIEKELNSLYIPVKFAEEEYSVYRASDFFLRVLEEQGEDISGILSLNNEDDILYAALERLKEISKKENKIYLIFVENLHEVFRQFDAKEVQKLRSIFQKHDFFSVMASSPVIFPGVAEHEEPFYNFFRIQHLRELSLDETKALLKKISEIEGNREFLENFKKYEPRIEGIAHLTGGSPRLTIFFYELISRDNFEDIEKVFFKILDEHTPYYQEIFQVLTGQRRLIFDTLISSESPMTPKHIAEKSRVAVSTVITQLRRLEKDGYVLSRPAGRETYYEVRERLFRLWRDMRQPLGRNRISVFLDFLKLWYTSEEQKELFDKKFHLLESGNKEVLKDLCYYVEVLPNKYKTEALMKLTPKMIEFEEWEEADHEIQKLKEIASKNTDIDLKAKSLILEILSNYKHDKIALETLKKALKFDTKDYSVLLESGRIAICNEILKAFDKVLDLNPDDEYALSRKGVTLLLLDRCEEALEAFNKVLEINPENEYALSKKGSSLFSLEKDKEALEVFNKVLDLNSENGYALLSKGVTLLLLNRYEEALEVSNKILDLNPDNEYVLLLKGISSESLKNHEGAIESFDKVLELNPENRDALSGKCDVLVSLEKYEETLEVLTEVLELNPNNEYALSEKGYILLLLNRYEEAVDFFDKALELNSDDKFALSMKGYSLNLLKKYDGALKVFDNLLRLNPDDEHALLLKGIILSSLENYKDAIESFDKVLELNPENKDALSGKCDALVSLEKYEEVIEILNKALELDSNNEYALSEKAYILFLLNRYEESIELFEKVLAMNPNDEFSLLYEGFSLDSLERYEESIDVLDKVLELNPNEKDALATKGSALVSLGKYEESIEVFSKVKLTKCNEIFKTAVSLRMIEAYLSLNKINEAINEIESIKYKVTSLGISLIERFIYLCWNVIFEELRIGNLGSGRKFIRTIFDLESKIEKETFETLMMNFFKKAVDSAELEVLKTAIGEILELKGDNYPELLKPLVKAVEIVETKDVQKYYKLQVEEREIVADIVQKLSDSGDLLP